MAMLITLSISMEQMVAQLQLVQYQPDLIVKTPISTLEMLAMKSVVMVGTMVTAGGTISTPMNVMMVISDQGMAVQMTAEKKGAGCVGVVTPALKMCV